MEIFHLWPKPPPPPPKDGKVEQKKTSFRVLMAFSPIIGIKDGKSKKKGSKKKKKKKKTACLQLKLFKGRP